MRLRLSAVACVLVLAGLVSADDEPRTNVLSPKDAAAGWIHLFDGETTFGLEAKGGVKVDDGVLVIDGSKAGQVSSRVRFPVPVEIVAVAKWTGTGGGLLGIGGNATPVSKDQWADFRLTCVPIPGGYQTTTEMRKPGEDWKSIGKGTGGLGRSTIATNVTPGAMMYIRSIKLRPLGTEPLFNGKDLSGWKVFADPKRMNTKFEVTKDGELSAKNGPGDLQTEKQFDNFLLQLECKTNGKGLNSGVFFRCVPGQYQNGYEAQIHNAFKDDDRTKPVDFGTGAIYRRVPARKVVSNDNEWFTMTVVADGNHFATWVNGYQTVAWTDERPPEDNPRQGFRAEKGHISLQGHDPTTDLLFRNIRIAELPAKK
ncbi:MAG TPA: DUF1080 domain-containing protein [Gemmataceae bacterium]|nr:DUF1080 domain-containing protein [Gemmataceae bacterium]